MASPDDPGGLYQLLGVPPDAPAAEITRAYRRRARAVHPDARPGNAGSAEEFREVEAAYRVLGDPARRAAYDQVPAPSAPLPPLRPARPAPPGWQGGRLPGATLWAGPAFVVPATPAAEPAETPLAVLALLLARHLSGESRSW